MYEVMTTTSYKNGLEQLLFKEEVNDLKMLCNEYNKSYGYEKGMFISIANQNLTYMDLCKQYQRFYQSLLLAISDRHIHYGQVVVKERNMPSEAELMKIVNSKKLFVVAAIHDYDPSCLRGTGKKYDDAYKQNHFYVYNLHKYLPSEAGLSHLKDKEEKIKKYLGRYVGVKKNMISRHSQRFIDITAVGFGKYRFRDRVSPDTLYKYLTDTTHEGVINYMRYNHTKPEVQYPLHFLYEK